MRRDTVYEEYAAARKNLISEARHSFDEAQAGKEPERNMEESAIPFYESAKLHFFLSMLLFIGFLYCWYTDTKIFGYSAENVVEMMEDDSYYTVLKDYIELGEQ